MELIIEFFGELVLEIIVAIFGDSAIGTSNTRYIPKPVRVLILSIPIAILALIIFYSCKGNKELMLILLGMLAIGYVVLLVKALKSNVSKYIYARILDRVDFRAKRSILGWAKGKLHLENIEAYTNEYVEICFDKSPDIERKKRLVKLEEDERQFLTKLLSIDENEFYSICEKARNELMKKHKDLTISLVPLLYRVDYYEDVNDITITYRFKDDLRGKKISIREKNKKIND